MASGVISSTALYPVDVVRRRLQRDGTGGVGRQYKGIIDCGMQLIRKEGFRSLYSGLSFECVKVCPTVVLLFGTYEVVKSQLKCWDSDATPT